MPEQKSLLCVAKIFYLGFFDLGIKIGSMPKIQFWNSGAEKLACNFQNDLEVGFAATPTTQDLLWHEAIVLVQ